MNNLIRVWKQRGKIAEGILNSVFKKDDVEEIASYRLEICSTCPHIDKIGSSCVVPGTSPCCSLCGCCLSLKTRSLSSGCDDKRWFPELTEIEEDTLKEKLNIK